MCVLTIESSLYNTIFNRRQLSPPNSCLIHRISALLNMTLAVMVCLFEDFKAGNKVDVEDRPESAIR